MNKEQSRHQVNPDLLVLARESRGLTQIGLAERLGITQSKVSKMEAGLLLPCRQDLVQLAQALDYPPHFFEWPDRVYGFATHEMFHRKRQKLSVRTLAKVHAEMNIRRMQLSRLLKSTEIEGEKFRHVDPVEYDGNIEAVAQAVRASWQLPAGPIRNVTDVIEAAGGVVIQHDFGTRQIDAVSQWIPGLPPIFFVNTDFPTDRLRYTLCHEIGHIVMHSTVGPDAEREADRFAAEFLLPAREIRPALHDVSLPVLASLKRYWRVSMQALLMRARQLETITERQARTLWMQMSKLGYRLKEPIELPPEQPTLFRELLELHRTELNYSFSDLAELLAENHIRALCEGRIEHENVTQLQRRTSTNQVEPVGTGVVG